MPAGVYPRASLADRFWSKVDKSGGPDACWLWTGGSTPDGYGTVSIDDCTHLAHRIAWELEHGPIPAGLWVLHRCDNPPCVNETHLFLGTNVDNSADRDAKGRHVGPRGESHHWARLTTAEVSQIRARHAAGSATQRQIAAEFGIGQSTVSEIVNLRKRRIA